MQLGGISVNIISITITMSAKIARKYAFLRRRKGNEGFYNAILKYFGTLSNGLASMLDDGIGVIFDGAGEIVLVANLDGFVDRRS